MPSFPDCRQFDSSDCGAACLRMIARHYGKNYTLETLRERSRVSREGVSLAGIADAAETLGFRVKGVMTTFANLAGEVGLPCIVHWEQNHFVVVYKIKGRKVFVADPASGLRVYAAEEFLSSWISTAEERDARGICLILETTPEFYSAEGERPDRRAMGFLFAYLRPYRRLIVQVILGLFVGSLLQLIFPFLTQAIVDVGIRHQDVGFIYLVLIAQLVLFASRVSVGVIRSWILLHVSARINIFLISDFLVKLMKLPISFFETRLTGDVMQRIDDHHRVETFLTTSTLEIALSFLNLVIFGFVLALYDLVIFGVFVLGSGLYATWICLFLKRRRVLDFRKFTKLAENQSQLIQLISGMHEIKLNTCERQKRWSWEAIQARLFELKVKSLRLEQTQLIGSVSINETKNILITILAAEAVIDGHMTLGMMLAVQYILGQLNAPVEQMVRFVHAYQDAKFSLERLGEVHAREDEERGGDADAMLLEPPQRASISVKGLRFRYDGPAPEYTLDGLDLEIPEGRVTALVGPSGSGKTTLLKLLLGFYLPTDGGVITIGGTPLSAYRRGLWRRHCGVVLQDGYLFADSIANNIALGADSIDQERLTVAVDTAHLTDLIAELPAGVDTQIGAEGHGLSQGQKQRILIARAVYKDPAYLFLDEATNALDARSERMVVERLRTFLRDRTVLIVAHRLSTVKDADQIAFLDRGRVVERGTHEELVRKQGAYFALIKDQLDLGA